MAYDPLAMDDPSHPLHGFATNFAQMRQRRQMHDQRQQMLAQQLAQPGAPAANEGRQGAGSLPIIGPAMSNVSGLMAASPGLAALGNLLKQTPAGEYSAKIGGSGASENTGGWLQNLFTANGGAKS